MPNTQIANPNLVETSIAADSSREELPNNSQANLNGNTSIHETLNYSGISQPLVIPHLPSVENNKKKLDIAFLFSDPLVMKDDSKKLIPFTENIDTEGEFLRLCRFLSDANKNKQIILKRDSANSNNLR